jgi:hypothetical protein
MKYLQLLAALAFGLLVACSRETETPKIVTRKTLDLGVIDVADGKQMIFGLAGGQTCRITPIFQKDGNVLLDMAVEENGKVVSRPRIRTPFDMPVAISDGVISVSLTARKKT